MDALIKGSNTDRSKFTQVSSSHFLFLGGKKKIQIISQVFCKSRKNQAFSYWHVLNDKLSLRWMNEMSFPTKVGCSWAVLYHFQVNPHFGFTVTPVN